MMFAMTIAPDDERDPRDQDHQQESARGDVLPELLEHLRRHEPERIVLVELRLAQRPQDRADLVGRGGDARDAGRGLDENADVRRRRDVLLEERQRHVDDVVLALSDHVALLGERPDDLHGIAVDLHDAADRVLVREELVLDVPADDADRRGRGRTPLCVK